MAMFSDARTPEQEEEDLRKQAFDYARLTPEQQITADSVRGNQRMAQGIQQGVGGALGVDMRSPGVQQRANETAARDEIAKLDIDPQDIDKYYPAVIRILMKYKMVDAAMAAQKEFQQRRNEQRRTDIQLKGEERKLAADKARNEVALKRIELDRSKQDRMGPAAMQMIMQLQRLQATLGQNPDDQTTLAAIERLKDALEVELAKNKFQLKDAGGKLVVFDTTTGDVSEGVDKTAKPATAKEERANKAVKDQAEAGIRQAQEDIANAVRLYNHKGLPGITGAIYGRTPSVSEASMSAMALYEQVQAGTFLAALRSLKGPENKPTGLGSLTEVEGAKIQSAMAALSRVQSTESFRFNLEKYIRQVERSMAVLARAVDAQPDLTPVQLPAAGGPEAKRTVKVPASSKPAAAPSGDVVFERGADGRIRRK